VNQGNAMVTIPEYCHGESRDPPRLPDTSRSFLIKLYQPAKIAIDYGANRYAILQVKTVWNYFLYGHNKGAHTHTKKGTVRYVIIIDLRPVFVFFHFFL
jgi:hypothetical protein